MLVELGNSMRPELSCWKKMKCNCKGCQRKWATHEILMARVVEESGQLVKFQLQGLWKKVTNSWNFNCKGCGRKWATYAIDCKGCQRRWATHEIDCKDCWSGQFMKLIARIVEVMALIVARIVEMGDSWNYDLVMERTHQTNLT